MSHPSRALRTLVAVAVLVGLSGALAAWPAAPAGAHAELEASSPASGASLRDAPAEVRLTFGDAMRRPSTITVVAPDGSAVGVGPTTVDGSDVSRAVDDPGLAGTFQVDYEAVSDDGHVVRGSYRFEVTSGTPATSDATSGPLEGDRLMTWFLVGFGVLAGLVLVVAAFGRFRRGPAA